MPTKHMRRWKSVSTIALVLGLPAVAHAAENESIDPAPSDTIVVTATRTAQPLARVPLSVSAFDNKALDVKGAKSVEDIVRFTPGIRFDPASDSVVIRGIASTAGSGTTGIYIDDVPIQMRNLGFSADNTLPALFDLDRVEIIRGPQGTVFGAGSEGGSVRYITPAPSLTSYSGYAHSEVSAMEHGGISYEAGAALGGPIVADTLGFRVSAWHRRDGGYVDRVDNVDHHLVEANANHSDVTVLRGALAWKPADGLTITPALLYQRRFQHDTDLFWSGISDPAAGKFLNGSPEMRPNPDRFILPSLTADYHFDGLRLVSVSSWFNRNDLSGYDGTLLNLSYFQTLGSSIYPLLTATGINPAVSFYQSPSHVENRQRNFTQEIRLQSDDADARLNWVAGVFYQRARQRSREELRDPLADQLFPLLFGMTIADFFGAPLYNGIDSYINQTDSVEQQIAGFANIRYKILPSVTLEAGVRYARSHLSFTNFADGSENGGRTESSGSITEHPVTPRVSVEWQADRDTMLYASWSKGYRSGGVNASVPVDVCHDDLTAFGLTAAPDHYDSDSVDSFEIGGKGSLLDHRLSLSASVYQSLWHNIQEAVLLPTCSIQYTDNLGQARVRGFDLQFTARPIAGITIDGSLSYTDARYTTNAWTGTSTLVPPVAIKGDTLGGPPWTIGLGVQYAFEAKRHPSFVRIDYQYASFQNGMTPERDPASAMYDPLQVAPSATHFVSARAGTTLGQMDIALFVNNALDNAPRLDRVHFYPDALLYTERTWTPRTIGLSATYRLR